MTWKQVRGLFFDYWWIGALALVLILAGLYAFCGDTGRNEKNERIESNIDQHKGEANVISNLVDNQNGVVTNAATNTNQAVNALNNSINRPSNSFDGNRANDRFCRDFPTDPSCK
jgi:hypothetical protein